MQVEGRCHCGEIEYTAEVNPGRVVACHCRDCQVMGGGPFRVVAGITAGDLKITRGETRHFDKTAESGNVRRQHFCGTCGTPLYASSPDPDNPGVGVSLRIMSCDQHAQLPPIAELWCCSRLPWLPVFDAMQARFDKQPVIPSE